MLPEKVGQSSPKLLKTCYPLRLHIMPNFIEIGQTSLEKSVRKNWASDKKIILSRTEVAPLSVRQARLKNWPLDWIMISIRGFAPDPKGGAYSTLPWSLARGERARRPLPKNPTAPRPFGLVLRLFGPVYSPPTPLPKNESWLGPWAVNMCTCIGTHVKVVIAMLWP